MPRITRMLRMGKKEVVGNWRFFCTQYAWLAAGGGERDHRRRWVIIITMTTPFRALLAMFLFSLTLSGCGSVQSPAPTPDANTAQKAVNKNANADDDPKGEFMRSETGTAIATPKPGKANIQGTVFFNLNPVEGVEVKLCVDAANLYGECMGKKYVAKTDKDGHYLFADLEPQVYNSLFVRVFKTPNYVHAAKYGFLSLKIRTEADKTFFVPLTSLFKADLKVLNPTQKAKVNGQDLEISWEPYPDAASYSIDLLQYGSPGVHHLDGVKTKANRYKVENPLPNGSYRLRMEAFNSSGIKLAQTGDGVEFSINNLQ